jgi:hypothetical protein
LEIFREIVALKTGEALVFCPKAMLDTVTENPDQIFDSSTSIRELQGAYFKMQVRKRITVDGGKSILAFESSQAPAPKLEISELSFARENDAIFPVPNLFQPALSRLESPKPAAQNGTPIASKATANPMPNPEQTGDERAGSALNRETHGESSDESEEPESTGASTPIEETTINSVSRKLANTSLSTSSQSNKGQATASSQISNSQTTSTHQPFVFQFDSVPKGAPVFPVFTPLKKGKRPSPRRFEQLQELDLNGGGVMNRYQSITATSSWYKRLSFEVSKCLSLRILLTSCLIGTSNV